MTLSAAQNPDFLVIGGGLVGCAVAYGLAGDGAKVTLLDQGDFGFRASRGNFGLVWIQGKGYNLTDYARWSRTSAECWPALAQKLLEETDIDVALRQPGGLHFCFTDEELAERQHRLATLKNDLGGDYRFEILDRAGVRARVPAIGPEVIGASYTPMDGHVNPLKLLRALHSAVQLRGVCLVNGENVTRIVPLQGSGFEVHGGVHIWRAPRIVLAAGLGNRDLAPQVGLYAPVAPNRGQILISERVKPFLSYPTHVLRQTDEGTVQFGDSLENVGYNDFTSANIIERIAQYGIKTFPLLRDVNMVRTWAALRVYSPDGFPIYQQSDRHPGAFVVTCHSGVTLAAAHATRIAPWIAGGDAPTEIRSFSGQRFQAAEHVPTLIPLAL